MWNSHSVYGSVFTSVCVGVVSFHASVCSGWAISLYFCLRHPQSSEQRLLAAQIKTSVIFFSLTLYVCACVSVACMCVCVFVCLFGCVSMSLCMFVRRRLSMHVVPSCLLAWPATFCSKYIFSTLLFFFSSPLLAPLPRSLHFRVILDRTTLAAGNSPLSTLHPKACGF